MLRSKERKRLKAEAEQKAREEEEFNAKYTAKQECRKIEKTIAEMTKKEGILMQKAVEAKQKGQVTIYRNYVSGIKVVRACKQQAENCLAQVDMMQTMQSITGSTKELLGSMGNIMSTLGKITLDKTAIINAEKDFAHAQQELDKQGALLDQYFSGVEMVMPEEESSIAMSGVDKGIDSEIDSMILNNSVCNMSDAGSQSSDSVNDDIAQFQRLLRK